MLVMEKQKLEMEDDESFGSISSDEPQTLPINKGEEPYLSLENASLSSKQLEDFHDYDNDSFDSFDSFGSNDIVTSENEEKSKFVKWIDWLSDLFQKPEDKSGIERNGEKPRIQLYVKWIDWFYDLFQKPEERLDGTEDTNNDLTYEESQMRIMTMGSFLALSLAIIASIISGILLAAGQLSPMVFEYSPPEPKLLFRTPHVALLFSNGLMTVYDFNASNQLELNWNFTVQKLLRTGDAGGQYFAFSDKDDIHVIYSDMRRVNSIIKSKNNHFTIPNKNILLKKVFTKSGYFRVGHYLWVFGGYQRQIGNGELIGPHGSITVDNEKTMLWHTVKRRWLWGPNIPYEILGIEPSKQIIHKGSCGLPIQRNVGAIFFFHPKIKSCLVVLVAPFIINYSVIPGQDPSPWFSRYYKF